MTPTNDHADHAAQALALPPYGADPDAALTDLLADLRHWARREGIDYDAADSSAADHFAAEVEGR